MRPGGGKTKGNTFENRMGRALSFWLTLGQDGTQLISSRQSGGWRQRKKRQAGDLAPNGPYGERFREVFLVECKHRKTDLLWALITEAHGKENLQGWWRKLLREAQQKHLCPMLIWRQNRRPTMVLLPVMVCVQLGVTPTLYFQDFGLFPLDTLMHVAPDYIYGIVGELHKAGEGSLYV